MAQRILFDIAPVLQIWRSRCGPNAFIYNLLRKIVYVECAEGTIDLGLAQVYSRVKALSCLSILYDLAVLNENACRRGACPHASDELEALDGLSKLWPLLDLMGDIA